MAMQIGSQIISPAPTTGPGTGRSSPPAATTPEQRNQLSNAAQIGNELIKPGPTPGPEARRPVAPIETTPEQRGQIRDATQDIRDSARQVAVGVAEINTRRQIIDTYVNASSNGKSDDSSSGVTAADIRNAQQTRTQRQFTVEFLDRAQNGELRDPTNEPRGNLIDTQV
jgi:hypothetical protein